jgi:predicted metalloendopeptidase
MGIKTRGKRTITKMKIKTKKNNKGNKGNESNKEKKGCDIASANTYNQFEKEYEKSAAFKAKKKHVGINKELMQLVSLHKTPKGVTAQNDYFTFINYLWILQQTKTAQDTKKYYVQVDNFRIAQERVYYQLIDIVKESKNANIKRLAESVVSLNQKSMDSNIQRISNTINTFLKSGNLIDFLAFINHNEIVSWGSPIFWKLVPDAKNPRTYINQITSPIMAMFEYELLVNSGSTSAQTTEYTKFYKKKRIENITILFDTCLGKGHGLIGSDVWDVEYELFLMFSCDKVKQESSEFYNILSPDESSTYGFDWRSFSKAIGYKTPPTKFVCTSLKYLKCVMETLTTSWTTPKWKAYWHYIFLRQMSRFGNSYEKILYGFMGKFVQGQDVIFPRELAPIFALSICYNSFLTNEYATKYKKQENNDYVRNMAEDLKTVFMRILQRNTWLSPKTKAYSIKKLSHLNLIVGSPEITYTDPDITYSATDTWGNMEAIMNWRCGKFVSLSDKPVIDIPYVDWREMPFKLVGKQSYIVNAYYTPIENSIYIPQAYLQKPFIDLDERGIEYNLAHIGFTIGHELSHSLDNVGSRYDHTGKLFNWWLPADKKNYELKLQDIVKQYETFAEYDDVKFDVHMSLSEDLADISGLAICEEYLRDFQEKNDDIAYIRNLSFEAFFCYYAIQARQAISKKAITAQLKNNPHPLDKYRVNCTLARLELFKTIYNVKQTDKMFWKNRDTFWGHD